MKRRQEKTLVGDIKFYKQIETGGLFAETIREKEAELKALRQEIAQKKWEDTAMDPEEEPTIKTIKSYRQLIDHNPFDSCIVWTAMLSDARKKLGKLRTARGVTRPPLKEESEETEEQAEKKEKQDAQKEMEEEEPQAKHSRTDNGSMDISKNSTKPANSSSDTEKEPSTTTTAPPVMVDNVSCVYELYSVLIHSGSTSGGHYYAYIKSFEKDKWYSILFFSSFFLFPSLPFLTKQNKTKKRYSFNDSSVHEIEESDIEKAYGM